MIRAAEAEAEAEARGSEVDGSRLASAVQDQLPADGPPHGWLRETAHDLRAPLAAIAGYTEQLVDSAGATLPEEAQGAVAGVWHAISRMRSIIDGLLDGAGTPTQGTVDCDVLVTEVLELHARQLAESNTSVHVGRLGSVRGEPLHAFRIFQNLIGNAARHADRGDGLRLDITARAAGRYRMFTVADNGRGMPSSERRRVLTDRAGGERDRRGLGLSICRNLVERQGGRIWIQSAPGRGTAVTFTLPASGT